MTPVNQSTKRHRSSNGCGVCRIRRIKCDGTRPSCRKCMDTGRSCEGYRSSTNRSMHAGTRALAPSHIINHGVLSSRSHLSAATQRALQYYRVNTAKHLSGYLSDDFWTTLVLQIGDRDRCVNSALVALASLHEHFNTEAVKRVSLDFEQSGDALPQYGEHTGVISSLPMRYAISYYIEAARGLHVKISNACGGEEVETTLLCCLLLSGFEFLRGYHEAAQIHLHGSASLLQAWNERQKSGRGGSLWSPRGYFIREKLGPLFHRMALQAILYSNIGSSSSPSLSQFKCDGGVLAASIVDDRKQRNVPNLNKSTDRVSSPTEARDTLYRLICQLYLLPEERRYRPENRGAQTSRAKEKRRDNFIGRLHQWHRALNDYLEQQTIDDASSTMLRLFDFAARVIIPTCASDSDDQMSFDDFSAEFHEMTELAERLLFPLLPSPSPSMPVPPPNRIPPRMPGSEDESCFFSVDMGVLHLLYYVAVRCRVTATRRRAVALLQRARARREGVWDGAATALVADRVVAMEEERSKRERVKEMDADGGDSIYIPASARVRSIWTQTDLEKRTVVLRCGWHQGAESSQELLAW